MKPGILIAALGKKGDADDDMPEKDEGGDDAESMKVSAAQDMIDAIKSGDAEALSAAMEDHYHLCEESHEEPDEDDEAA